MPDIRASDAERERTVEALRVHAAAGRLDAGELEERLGLALAARTRRDLAGLLEDLPAEQPRRPVTAPIPARAARRHGCAHHKHDPRRLLGIAVLLVAIWAVTGAGYFWPMWPLMVFAVAALRHRLSGNTRVIGNATHTGNTVHTQ
jgi:hypothetical protein